MKQESSSKKYGILEQGYSTDNPNKSKFTESFFKRR